MAQSLSSKRSRSSRQITSRGDSKQLYIENVKALHLEAPHLEAPNASDSSCEYIHLNLHK
jgi:hypothetical protein